MRFQFPERRVRIWTGLRRVTGEVGRSCPLTMVSQLCAHVRGLKTRRGLSQVPFTCSSPFDPSWEAMSPMAGSANFPYSSYNFCVTHFGTCGLVADCDLTVGPLGDLLVLLTAWPALAELWDGTLAPGCAPAWELRAGFISDAV